MTDIQQKIKDTQDGVKQAALNVIEAVQAVEAEWSKEAGEVEQIAEHDVFASLKASPPADVAATLAAVEAMILDVNQKHTAIINAKRQKLADLLASIVSV